MAKLSSLDKYRLILPILEREMPATAVSRKRDISVRTLRYWVKQFSEKGLDGLERSKRSDNGILKVMTNEFAMAVEALALQKPPLSITAIHRKITIIAKKFNVKQPSYETIYGIVKKVNPAMLTLAQEGEEAYREKYEMIYRRECSMSNEMWQSDHTEMDIYIVDDNGRERKHWLTTIIDDYSRSIAGIFFSLDAPSAINTALALRQAFGKRKIRIGRSVGYHRTFTQIMEVISCQITLNRPVYRLRSGC